MKKLFYYFLIATLAFNFVGCSDKDKDLDDVIDELDDKYRDEDEDIVGKSIEYDGCTYYLDENNTAVLKHGFVVDKTTLMPKCVTGDFVVPQTISYKSKTYTVTRIDMGAFTGNKELTSLTLHDKIEHIADNPVPANIYKFKKLIIGKGIKSFGILSTVHDYITIIYATTPPKFKTLLYEGQDITKFLYAIQDNNMKLYVPSESIEAYKAHVYFKYYNIHSINELEEL